MSNKKISQLPRATQVSPSDQLAIVNQGVTKSIQVSDLVGLDTGWLDINLKTNYPCPETTRAPQYRVIGSTVYLRGNLFIPSEIEVFDGIEVASKTPSAIHVDENFVTATNTGAILFSTDEDSNLPPLAQPDRTIVFSNLLISRRYTVRDTLSTPFQLFSIPIVATVNFVINTDGELLIAGIQDVEDVPSGNDVVGTHPFRLASTKIDAGQAFPDFSHVSVGDSSNNNAIKLDTFKKSESIALTATENINTTQIEHLGGFSISLDGITYLNDGTNRWDFFINRH